MTPPASDDHALPFHRARPLTGWPPAAVNEPPTIRSPERNRSSVFTAPSTPLPSGDHAPLLRCATPAAATAPMCAKSPPTNRSPFGAVATAVSEPSKPGPLPSQLLPFQTAMPLAATPPAARNEPPTTSAPFGIRNSAYAPWPSRPLPSGAHTLPFQRAMRLMGTPPAVANDPAATTSPLPSTANALTPLSVPPPSDDQTPPFQLATPGIAPPFTVLNPPPARNDGPPVGTSVCTDASRVARVLHAVPFHCWICVDEGNVVVIEATISSPFGSDASAVTIWPPQPASGAQAVPFHRARLAAGTPPADWNWPPAIRSPLASTVRASTPPPLPMPVPSGAHVLPFHRAILVAGAPPGTVNVPPTTTSPFGMVTAARPPPGKPPPSGLHAPVVGSQLAMPSAIAVPATANGPVSTATAGCGPEPSGSHVVSACTGKVALPVPAAACPLHCSGHCANRGTDANSKATAASGDMTVPGYGVVGDRLSVCRMARIWQGVHRAAARAGISGRGARVASEGVVEFRLPVRVRRFLPARYLIRPPPL